MALIHLEHTPETVKVCLPLYIILPDPGKVGEVPIQQRKVLYLLHGLSDNGSAWLRYTNIEALAYEKGLVVVMPSFGRSFYADLPNGQNYFTYLTQELPKYLKDVFGLDPKREDTLIAGNSMGGYGAFKAALRFPEKYAAAASLSGVLSIEILKIHPDDQRKEEFKTIFGDLEQLKGTRHDPMVWLNKAAENPQNLPRLYVACGKEDDLLPVNRVFQSATKKLRLPVEYKFEDGRHDWLFWQKHIQRFLDMVIESEA